MSLTRLTAGIAAGLALAVSVASTALSQVRQPGDTLSAGEGSGPLSDVSTNVGDGSRPMHDGALTVGETSGGSMRSGPVRDSTTRGMLSGPVSSMSQGPVYEPRPSLSGGSVTEASAGAIKHDTASPLGTRISDPLRELGPLQKQMRERRQQAEREALLRAVEPAVPAIDDGAVDRADGAGPEPAPATTEDMVDEGYMDAGADDPGSVLEGAAPSAP